MEWREGDRDIGYGCGVVDKEEDEDFGCIALTSELPYPFRSQNIYCSKYSFLILVPSLYL